MSSTAHPTTTPTSPGPAPNQQPTVYFNHQAANKNHAARLQIKVVANGYLITDLIDVKLARCSWNLGSATAKHYQGGRRQLWIVVTRRHQHRPGSVQFRVVDSAGQKTFVKSRV